MKYNIEETDGGIKVAELNCNEYDKALSFMRDLFKRYDAVDDFEIKINYKTEE